eukprot:CAMPEP_0118935362 /NCGR_PEP_ID=MMETSP1169-20130426/15529_1 /TAXON_ID=36882 /ORGANISM="Pyramimonas obovata, Strain CCMP722" /LENGTH=205 /DNA_ID=CAMNT_0006878383 /DNA_START=141 /DNA_END=758 /DNA_ORIENTATION=-
MAPTRICATRFVKLEGSTLTRFCRDVSAKGVDGRREQLYITLGISPGASLTAVKKAYRQSAKRYHPDVCDDPDNIERFMEIQSAYEQILDDSGSLETVGQEWWRAKWEKQVRDLRKNKEERLARKQADREAQKGFESPEEYAAFMEIKRNVQLYEKRVKDERVSGQLSGLQERARQKRARRARPKPKKVWVEPSDFDDDWCHDVQ